MKMQARVGKWESVGGTATAEVSKAGLPRALVASQAHTSDKNTKTTGLAAWETYTKGFGSRMLQRMGYQKGKGLRSDGSGLVKPIEVEQHPAGMGLDMVGKKRQSKRKRLGRQQALSQP